jgi:hypothetical protein
MCVCARVCIFVCAWVHAYARACVYARVYVFISMCVCVYVRVCAFVYVHVCVCMRACVFDMHVCVRACVFDMHVCARAFVCYYGCARACVCVWFGECMHPRLCLYTFITRVLNHHQRQITATLGQIFGRSQTAIGRTSV